MLERGKAYIVKAGTIILVCNTIVQIMQSFNGSSGLWKKVRKEHLFWHPLPIRLQFCSYRLDLECGSLQQRQ